MARSDFDRFGPFDDGPHYPVRIQRLRRMRNRCRVFESVDLGAYPDLNAEPGRAETRRFAESQVVPHGA